MDALPPPLVARRPPAPQLTIELRQQAFEPLEALAAWQSAGPGAGEPAGLHAGPGAGTGPGGGGWAPAESQFIGRVRGCTAAGDPLEALELEHYPGMTEVRLEQLARECAARHGVLALLVVHRVGRIRPGEAIVLVAVAADRRGPAQRCGMELLEALKHEAPFWKREWSGGRGTWLEGNTAL